MATVLLHGIFGGAFEEAQRIQWEECDVASILEDIEDDYSTQVVQPPRR
jgi:hypothetical protein